MTRAVLELRQPVAAPAEVVWAEVVDWPAQGEWMLGTRVEVTRGDLPVRVVRLDSAPFTDRLVSKFSLPVQSWRGRSST